MAGLNANDMKLISALVVAVFLAIPYLKGKYFAKPVKKGGAGKCLEWKMYGKPSTQEP